MLVCFDADYHPVSLFESTRLRLGGLWLLTSFFVVAGPALFAAGFAAPPPPPKKLLISEGIVVDKMLKVSTITTNRIHMVPTEEQMKAQW